MPVVGMAVSHRLRSTRPQFISALDSSRQVQGKSASEPGAASHTKAASVSLFARMILPRSKHQGAADRDLFPSEQSAGVQHGTDEIGIEAQSVRERQA
jgi:hypothetical protein